MIKLHQSKQSKPSKDIVFSYMKGKQNSWILFVKSMKTLFLIDPPAIDIEILRSIDEHYAKKYYCILTREDNTRKEHFIQWRQIFPFTLLSHGQSFFDFNIKKKTPIHYSAKGIQDFYQGLEICRGKYELTHCLIAYKKPYLFSGEILQIGTDSKMHYGQFSKKILTYLDKLPRDTIIFPSVGPVGILEHLRH